MAEAADFAVSITARPELAMIAVQGPNACERFWAAFPVARAHSVMLQPFQAADWDEWHVRTGYTGETASN